MSKYCKKCGLPLDKDTKVCPSCGTPVVEVTVEEPAFDDNREVHEETKSFGKKVEEKFNEFNDTEDTTYAFDQKDIEDVKIVSLFSYIGILWLIPLIVCNSSKFAKFHINQGIILFLADIIVSVAIGVITPIFTLLFLGWVAAIADAVLGILLFVLMIIGIVNAVTGKAKRLPVIGKFDVYK